jgi:hypothetical protein
MSRLVMGLAKSVGRGMKRFLIFLLLGPLLGFLVFLLRNAVAGKIVEAGGYERQPGNAVGHRGRKARRVGGRKAAPQQHHVRQSAIGDRILEAFGMTRTRQSRGFLSVEGQVRLPMANDADISVERRDGELPVLAVHPFHVVRLAVDAQQNMVRHAGRGIACIKPTSCAVGETKPDLRDVTGLPG